MSPGVKEGILEEKQEQIRMVPHCPPTSAEAAVSSHFTGDL